jgi:HD-like signal output (HDOD) protein
MENIYTINNNELDEIQVNIKDIQYNIQDIIEDETDISLKEIANLILNDVLILSKIFKCS